MNPAQREQYLKIGAFAAVGLLALNYLVIDPFISHWNAQSDRLDELRKQVQHGRGLVQNEETIRNRWAQMQRTDLPHEASQADNEVFKAVNRWVRDSRVALTSMTPQWRTHDEGYETFECRASATGDQATLGKLIYDLETDPLPARLEECEFSTRDKTGKQLSLNLRFTFVRLGAAAAEPSR